jgi:hypothetical protein
VGLAALAQVVCWAPCAPAADAVGDTQVRLGLAKPAAAAPGSRLVLDTSPTGATSLSLRSATAPESSGLFTRQTLFNLLVSATDPEPRSTFGDGWAWRDAPESASRSESGMASLLDQFISGKHKPFKSHPMGELHWRLKPCSSADGGGGVVLSVKF